MGKRRKYFRGKRATAALQEESFTRNCPNTPPIRSLGEAKKVMQALIDKGYLFPAEKVKSRVLQSIGSKEYNEERYHVVLFDDPEAQKWALVKGAVVLFVILAVITFPQWPAGVRLGAWYLAVIGMVVMALLISILVVRVPMFYFSRLVVPPGVWIFPNLNEDGAIMDSFKPMWDFDRPGRNASRRGRRRRIGRDHDSGSENRSGSQREDGAGGEDEELEEASSPDARTPTASPQERTAGGGEGRTKSLAERIRAGAIDLRVDSENDGDNEGAENDAEADPDQIPFKVDGQIRKRRR